MSPRFSIVTPVFDPPPDVLRRTIESVRAQTFGDWELLLVDDHSTDPRIARVLEEARVADRRIRVVLRPENGGIVAASNDGLAAASGEWIVLLDHDDLLARRALAAVARAIDADPEIDYLYSDEDQLSPDGDHVNAFYKPDWSPERLRSQNYCCHLSVLRAALVEAVGGFHDGFDGSQDYDLILRVIEQARKVVHVPQVLYHWRTLPTSTASAASAKPYAFVAALKAVGEHLKRTHTHAEVSEAGPSLARVRRMNGHHPSITVIVPVDDTRRRIWGVDTLLARHVTDSLLRRTTYNNYNVIFVASDRLDDGEINQIRTRFVQQTSVVRLTGEFHPSQAFNVGLVACTTSYAVLLDSYCDIIDTDWIETLVAYLSRESVAAVAPVLVDQYGITLSSGLGLTPEPHDIGEGRQPSDLGPVGMFAIARECFGVRSRCAVVDVAALKTVGGFSRDYQTDVVDFDLACKLHEIGLHAIITPLVKVRLFDELHTTHQDSQLFATRWGRYAGNDPYTRIDTRARKSVEV